MGVKTNKAEYFEKLKGLLETYQSIFIVAVDNVSPFFHLADLRLWSGGFLTDYGNFSRIQVSSQQMHEIRVSLRGQGVVLMGKNTMVRRAIRILMGDFPEYERLLPFVKGK